MVMSQIRMKRQSIVILVLLLVLSLLYVLHNHSEGWSTEQQQYLPAPMIAENEGTTSTSKSNPKISNLYSDGIFRCTQTLKGLVFTENTVMGSRDNEISAQVTLSVVKSLSKEVIAHVKQIFNDDHNENIYFATIPAMVKSAHSIQIVQRIWLGQYEKMKTHYRSQGWSLNTMFNEWQNTWQENHFYHMTVDENYNVIKPGQLLGIPTTTNVKFTYKSDGLMDPRSVGPSVRLLLTLYDIQPNSVRATGPHSRLLKGDVLHYITKNNLEPKPIQAIFAEPKPVVVRAVTPTQPPRSAPLDASLSDTEYLDLQLSSMRRAIAKRVTQSKLHVPHLYISTDCLTSKLNQVKQSLAEEGRIVSLNDLIVKACATALQRIPAMNCTWIEGEIKPFPTVDISVAVATPSGLLTPIVPEANVKSVADISSCVKELAAKAKDGTLNPNEMHGGSFTVSNLGMYGIKEFTAVINPPQSAILAVGCEQPSLRDGSIVSMMNIALTFDARVVDESVAARFLTVLKELLENPVEIGI